MDSLVATAKIDSSDSKSFRHNKYYFVNIINFILLLYISIVLAIACYFIYENQSLFSELQNTLKSVDEIVSDIDFFKIQLGSIVDFVDTLDVEGILDSRIDELQKDLNENFDVEQLQSDIVTIRQEVIQIRATLDSIQSSIPG